MTGQLELQLCAPETPPEPWESMTVREAYESLRPNEKRLFLRWFWGQCHVYRPLAERRTIEAIECPECDGTGKL